MARSRTTLADTLAAALAACALAACGLMASAAWSLAGLPAATAEHLAGAAMRDVTPSLASLEAGETFLGGYGFWKRRGAATAIHDPLSARALCIADAARPGADRPVGTRPIGTRTLCIVIVDSLGLPGPVIERIATIAASTGLVEPERVLVGSTHTHAAPDLLGLWGGSPPEYREFLTAQTAAAVVDALERLRPAELHYAVGQAHAYNRRGWGHTDEELVVLQARAPDGAPIGTLINFAAHPVVSDSTNRAISSDFVHYLREGFERQSGAPVIFVNGALGDVTPGPRGVPAADPGAEAYWTPVERYGAALAEAAGATVPAMRPIGPGLAFVREDVQLPVDNWVLSFAQRLGILDDRMSGPPWDRRVSTSVAFLRLGAQVEAVAVPGEALTRLGHGLKAQLTAPARMILGQTGGSLGYFVPEDEWKTGRNRDYEESVSLGHRAAGALGAAIARLIGTAPAQVGPTTSRGD